MRCFIRSDRARAYTPDLSCPRRPALGVPDGVQVVAVFEGRQGRRPTLYREILLLVYLFTRPWHHHLLYMVIRPVVLSFVALEFFIVLLMLARGALAAPAVRYEIVRFNPTPVVDSPYVGRYGEGIDKAWDDICQRW